MPSKLRVLIVGCGNIAGGFDADREQGALPLTHAGAYSRNSSFRVTCCVDPDPERRQAFMQRWMIPEGRDRLDQIQDLVGCFDVISICSPTAFHAEHLDAAIRLKPRLIFCEKPVTPDLAETEKWVSRCADAEILLAVNHTRRWAPDVVRLSNELAAGHWGVVRSVVGHYNKGLLNNGGHMVDLLHRMLGDLQIQSVGRPLWDLWENDPSVPVVLTTEHGIPVYLNISHASDFAYFELQVITSQAVLSMEDGGARWRIRRAVDSPHFKGYKSLGVGQELVGEYAHAMTNAIANIHDALRADAPLASTGLTALAAQSVCDKVKRLAMACERT